MKVTACAIPDVLLIEPKVFGDDRGFFYKIFSQNAFDEATELEVSFVQDIHSRSAKNVHRGPQHYHLPPKAQGTLVRIVAGDFFDVTVDIRQCSPTCGQWIGEAASILGCISHKQRADGGDGMICHSGCAVFGYEI